MMFFKPIKQEDWVSVDFLQNLESLETQLELGGLFARSTANQLYAKLRHLSNALVGIITDYLNSDAFPIQKFAIFKDVLNILTRLQSCIDKLTPILNESTVADKKLRINEDQYSKPQKQEEITPELISTNSRKRKLNGDIYETLNNFSNVIKCFVKISKAASNIAEEKFTLPTQLSKLTEELQNINQILASLPALNHLIAALHQTINTFLKEYQTKEYQVEGYEINDDKLLSIQKTFETTQTQWNENNETAQEEILDITLNVQSKILSNLEEQETFIRDDLGSGVAHIEILKGFVKYFTPYTWEATVQLLKNINNAINMYCTNMPEEDKNKFTSHVNEEIKSAKLTKTLIIEAKNTLEKCYQEGEYTELIENLNTDHNRWSELKKNLQESTNQQDFANMFCDFMIETTEQALGTLREEQELTISP